MWKKVLLVILFFIISNVNAKELKYSDVFIENSFYIEEERLYKFYKEKKIYSDYMENSTNEYPYISDDYIVLEDKSFEKINEDYSVFDTKYIYNKLKKIKRISIRDINISGSALFFINEIEIYDKDTKIDYEHYCVKCNGLFKDTIYNGDYYSNDGYLMNISLIDILLKDEVYPEDLKIVLYSNNNSGFNIMFNIYLYDNTVDYFFETKNNYDSFDYIVYNADVSTKSTENIQYDQYVFEFGKSHIKKFNWENNVYISDDEKDEYFYNKVGEISLYSNKKKLYKYYNIRREYLNGYYSDIKDYIKDETQYIVRYKYLTGDFSDVLESGNNDSCENNTIVDSTNNENIVVEKNNDLCVCDSIVNNDQTNESVSNKSIPKNDSICTLISLIIVAILILLIYVFYKLKKEE